MIGVAARADEMDVAREFFELFKSPWEQAVSGTRYPVVLSTSGDARDLDADVLLLYGSDEHDVDRDNGVGVERARGPVDVACGGWTFPIYGRIASFSGRGASLFLSSGGAAAAYRCEGGTRVVWRIGYDLFQEVRHLLMVGQPAARACTPTLELHIDALRQLLIASDVPFVEVPPRPYGYDFICCLTHDVDFFGIKRHRFDWTLAGFVARASVGSLLDVLRGRRPVTQALRNWAALLSLPLVHLGVVRDFWQPFDSYSRADAGRRSTFYVIPRRGHAGIAPDGTVNAQRAVRYQASDIRDAVRQLVERGDEVAVHGIDAWRDADAGRSELGEVTSITGQAEAGVRMHWLYFAPGSPPCLEAAGFRYDSTCGYNDAIGYRAGTSQVFRLPATRELLELPMTIMDSALFYARRMALAPREALRRCRVLVAQARRFGGTVVINWHDRSLAPERLWERSYQELLRTVSAGDQTWFATASQAVAWFRWRRTIRFTVTGAARCVTVTAGGRPSALPPAAVRVHRPYGVAGSSDELPFDGQRVIRLPL